MSKSKSKSAVAKSPRSTLDASALQASGDLASGSAQNPATPSTDGARQRLIAEAAYYRAEKRSFAPGCELDDWLAAEAEITSDSLQQQSAPDLH